ncbi:hypothetical protein WJX77_007425 [Trebouxia sp. C0004]
MWSSGRRSLTSWSRPRAAIVSTQGDSEPFGQASKQQVLIDRIYQRSQPFEGNALRHLDSGTFTDDIALREGKNGKHV